MENLIVAIALYIVIVAIAYKPKEVVKTDNLPATTPEEIEEIPDWEKEAIAAAVDLAKGGAEYAPITITQPLPVVAFKVQKPVTGDRLEEMTIRQLYALASAKGIKRYKSMKKAELIANLK